MTINLDSDTRARAPSAATQLGVQPRSIAGRTKPPNVVPRPGRSRFLACAGADALAPLGMTTKPAFHSSAGNDNQAAAEGSRRLMRPFWFPSPGDPPEP